MQPDNPKLTAYVLDELNARDRDAVDSELARYPELAAEAEGLRRTADQLRRAFATAESPALSADARRAILGAAPASAANMPETAALESKSESTAVPDKVGVAASRTRAKEPMIVRLRRTFRWAACLAVLIGATYLLGLAAWEDTRPGTSLVCSLSLKGPTEQPLLPGGVSYEARLGLAAPSPNSPATAEQMQRLGNVTYTTTDSLDREGIASVDQASEIPVAGRFRMLERNGDVTVKQYISPSPQAQVASAGQITGARFYGFTPDASPASSATDTGGAAGARYEFEGKPQVSYAYQVPFTSKDSTGDGRPEVWHWLAPSSNLNELSLNQDDLTETAGNEFSASLLFTERFGEEIAADLDVFSGSPPASYEAYSPIADNPFIFASKEPVSTFSIDVDTASYSNIRRHLFAGQLPPKDAVRIEEMINAFRYDYPEPTAERPFSVNAEVGECPWAPAHRLVRVGLQGYRVDPKDRPPLNLVFLIDVSGSMQAANKLPLVQGSLKVLLEQLWAEDRVGIVTYAGESAIALPSTPGTRYDEILAAIDGLSSGGSTNGEAGIRDAYLMAEDNFIAGGVNRVMLCTDGDFNVGISDDNELAGLISLNAKSGVFLTVLGFGTGNLKDGKLEALADKGNGHYAYIDDLTEAKRVLGDEAGATLQTIAKDVKIQVEFNPSLVQSYRLIGYENRLMAAQDFADDTKDAGEIGAGHSVTALYEVAVVGGGGAEEVGGAPNAEQEDADVAGDAEGVPAGALLTLRLRYKAPESDVSTLIEESLTDGGAYMEQMSGDFLFAASVASFGMLLRGSPHAGDWTLEAVEELARSGVGDDATGYRAEFVELVRKAIELRATAAPSAPAR